MSSETDEYQFSTDDLDKFMDAAKVLVLEVGEIIVAAMEKQGNQRLTFVKQENVNEGNSSAILTETDTIVEKHLVQGLKALFKDHEFIGEEDVSENGQISKFSNKPTWIIDPIDGTMNFVHCNPLVCTSIALTINRKLVLGIVNNPVTKQMYTAIKGKGAYLNGQGPCKTSGIKKLKDAMVLMELPSGSNPNKKKIMLENVSSMMDKAHSIRCPGPAALDMSWVGMGFADAFLHYSIHCWDMAAAALIINEAGGSIVSGNGSEFDLMGRGVICGASIELAKEMVDSLTIYQVERDFPDICLVL